MPWLRLPRIRRHRLSRPVLQSTSSRLRQRFGEATFTALLATRGQIAGCFAEAAPETVVFPVKKISSPIRAAPKHLMPQVRWRSPDVWWFLTRLECQSGHMRRIAGAPTSRTMNSSGSPIRQ